MSRIQAGEVHKQISLLVPLADWKRLRAEAARRRVSMTELCREWLAPHLQDLRHARPER